MCQPAPFVRWPNDPTLNMGFVLKPLKMLKRTHSLSRMLRKHFKSRGSGRRETHLLCKCLGVAEREGFEPKANAGGICVGHTIEYAICSEVTQNAAHFKSRESGRMETHSLMRMLRSGGGCSRVRTRLRQFSLINRNLQGNFPLLVKIAEFHCRSGSKIKAL